MRVLIVGCGYVGFPLAKELARLGHDVSGLRRSASAVQALEAAGIRPVTADITNPRDLEKLSAHFDWVVNCVASGGGDEAAYRRLYLEGTRNLLAWLAGAPTQKFVYTSSTSVYPQNDGSWVEETSPAEPVAATARVLRETEDLLLDAAKRTAFPAVILRVAGIYGPGRGYLLRQYLAGTARMDGNGDRFLNMIHRDDVVGCVIGALQRGRAGEIYNAVDDEPVTQRDFFSWLADRLGPVAPPITGTAEQRKRGMTNKRVSNRKLKTELGYHFQYPTYREGYGEELRRSKLP